MAPEKECFVSHTCVSLLYLPTQCQKPTIPRFLLSDWEISLNCGQSTEIKRKFLYWNNTIFWSMNKSSDEQVKPISLIKCGGQMYQIWAGGGGDKGKWQGKGFQGQRWNCQGWGHSQNTVQTKERERMELRQESSKARNCLQGRMQRRQSENHIF